MKFMMSCFVYSPEKHIATSGCKLTPPMRSGANIHSSSRTPSTIFPPMNSRAEPPPPRCSTMSRQSASGLCSTSLAQRMAMARQFSACPVIIRGSSGKPDIRASSVISSTVTGSQIKAGMPRGRAIRSASTQPRLDACAASRTVYIKSTMS